MHKGGEKKSFFIAYARFRTFFSISQGKNFFLKNFRTFPELRMWAKFGIFSMVFSKITRIFSTQLPNCVVNIQRFLWYVRKVWVILLLKIIGNLPNFAHISSVPEQFRNSSGTNFFRAGMICAYIRFRIEEAWLQKFAQKRR